MDLNEFEMVLFRAIEEIDVDSYGKLNMNILTAHFMYTIRNLEKDFKVKHIEDNNKGEI
jgi:hypothetical protein